MITALVVLALIVVVVIGVISYLVGIYNNLVTLKNDIDRSFSNIDVFLKQRHDELPKLIETCKGYIHFYNDTAPTEIDALTLHDALPTLPQKAQADNMVTGALRTLFAVAEKYPDLKANA